ncbi:MAG: phosphatidate cytidylyltransferase [Desulfarculaceae bacterium]|nr:phosphatidate cytidylyltransferase [Desulfarculaceae bacterium]
MLLKRWITAIILFPVLLVVLVKADRLTLSILISVVSLLSAREYLKIVRPVCGEIADKKIQALFYLTCAAMPISARIGSEPAVFSVIAVNFLLAGCIALSKFSRQAEVFNAAARQVLGVVYIPSFLSLLVLVHELDQGALWIIWLLLVVFAGDTGAYYTGCYLGKRKLAPGISPKKTFEGAAGGIGASIVMGVAFYAIVFSTLQYIGIIFISALLIAVTAQAGDLFASAMKRAGGIKDSGSLLPGHGGVIDRIDGFMFAVPVLYVLKVFVL